MTFYQTELITRNWGEHNVTLGNSFQVKEGQGDFWANLVKASQKSCFSRLSRNELSLLDSVWSQREAYKYSIISSMRITLFPFPHIFWSLSSQKLGIPPH